MTVYNILNKIIGRSGSSVDYNELSSLTATVQEALSLMDVETMDDSELPDEYNILVEAVRALDKMSFLVNRQTVALRLIHCAYVLGKRAGEAKP